MAELAPIKNIYDLLDEVKSRPNCYVLPAEEVYSSLSQIDAMMGGFQLALHEYGIAAPAVTPPFHHFLGWVSRRLGNPAQSLGWTGLISAAATSDAEALRRFFSLFDEFRARTPDRVGTARIGEKHKPTGNFNWNLVDRDMTFAMPHRITLTHYTTDAGCYIHYAYREPPDCWHWEYLPSWNEAVERVRLDFGVQTDDWDITDLSHTTPRLR